MAVALTGALGAGVARAQATPDAVPPPPPPAAETPAPLPPPPPPAAPPPAAVPAPAVTNTEAMPATKPDTLPPIDVGAWTRVGSVFQKSTDPSSLGDWHMNSAAVELHAGGKIHKNVGVTVNLAGNMLAWDQYTVPSQDSLVLVEDAIVSFDFKDEFHLWAGHLLVPVDRANASGPYFMIPWYYPGFFALAGPPVVVAAPREGPMGRNNGTVLWGDISGGKLTYLAGVFDNAAVATSPLFSGRLRLALLDPEPGFWGNGSYFGDKDLLSIGVGSQYQQQTGKDYYDINADVLFEKKLGGGSFVTAEGAYYHYNVNDGSVSDTFYILAAFATQTVGVGNIQPSVRYQYAKVKGPMDDPWNIDVGLAYLIKGPALRVVANYDHTKYGSATANSLTLAAQAIFF